MRGIVLKNLKSVLSNFSLYLNCSNNFKSSGWLLIVAIILLSGFYVTDANSQVSAGGLVTRPSSQLVFWYDEINRDSFLQVTNTNPNFPVGIHVQIFQTFDPDMTGPAPVVRCVEADFNDVLTQNDTHLYILEDIILNDGESDTNAFVTSVDNTAGFVVITPVVGNDDNSAISWQWLIGTTGITGAAGGYRVNAAGRDAVNLATGAIVPDGTVLDGVTTGFLLIQPEEFVFNVSDEPGVSNYDVVAISYEDVFGPPGLLGYDVNPTSSNWNSFLFDFEENPGSCPILVNTCFNNWGLNSQFPQINNATDPDVSLCPSVNLFDDANGFAIGWSRTFITGLAPAQNQLAIINRTGSSAGAEWAGVVGEAIPIVPPENCTQEGDEDGVGGADCADAACNGEMGPDGEICENGIEMTCDDGFDNDVDGAVDIADTDCDDTPGAEGTPEGGACDDMMDNDGDGLIDCDDAGCADIDSDNDSTLDCNESCDNDPNKTEPGDCGCGNPETDTDNDGTPDCNDSCPSDMNKIAPGVCGCGNPETDTDNDGTPDCNDSCPSDMNKTAPGVCGCGNPETDTDNDGTPDCNDSCPNDMNKTAPGVCGCGNPETDTDNDDTPDCNDDCPNDMNKTKLGICGCGVADTDTDTDGIADCNDTCSNDSGNDEDNDMICGDGDNCPQAANSDQADNDEDGIGDACDDDDDNDEVSDENDNCPLMANEDQADDDSDGVGNVCDNADDSPMVMFDTNSNDFLTINFENIQTGGEILIGLPGFIEVEFAELSPNVGNGTILNLSSTANIQDPDVTFTVNQFPDELDVILDLCSNDENANGVVDAEVEVVLDTPEREFETVVDIIVAQLNQCSNETDISEDSDSGGGGCSIALQGSKPTALSILYLLPLLIIFRRFKRFRKRLCRF